MCILAQVYRVVKGLLQGPWTFSGESLFCLGLCKVLHVAFGVWLYSSLWSSQDSAWLQDDVRVAELWGRLDVDGLYLWVK